MVRLNKNLPWLNLTLFSDVRHQFVLTDQDGVLVGHMSFQEKKIICSQWLALTVWPQKYFKKLKNNLKTLKKD